MSGRNSEGEREVQLDTVFQTQLPAVRNKQLEMIVVCLEDITNEELVLH